MPGRKDRLLIRARRKIGGVILRAPCIINFADSRSPMRCSPRCASNTPNVRLPSQIVSDRVLKGSNRLSASHDMALNDDSHT